MKTTILLTAISLFGLAALAKDLTEAEIDHEAKFIIKAVNYVTWPDGSGKNADGEIVVAIIGESQLTARLAELAAEKTADGTKITVVTKTLEDDLTDCQLLFIATEDKTELAKVLKKIKQAPVLTVSDADYFGRYGVMVNFYKKDDDSGIKFEVNTMTLSMAKLEMSSKLLKMATVI